MFKGVVTEGRIKYWGAIFHPEPELAAPFISPPLPAENGVVTMGHTPGCKGGIYRVQMFSQTLNFSPMHSPTLPPENKVVTGGHIPGCKGGIYRVQMFSQT